MRQTTDSRVIRTALLLVCCAASASAQTAPAAAARPLVAAPSGDARNAALNDVDHLLQLARELKASIDKTRRDELSLQVIREADEIEKLARSTKARMH